MKSKAAIVQNGEVIAFVETSLKNGDRCRYAFFATKESINANRDLNLVNARDAKISRANKYLKLEKENFALVNRSAKEINEAEFLISE